MKSVQHINVLGKRAKDPVSGLEGVIKSVSFDLNGCIQAAVQPPAKDGEYKSSYWFDIAGLEIGDSVVAIPDFDYTTMKPEAVANGEKGSVSKPSK